MGVLVSVNVVLIVITGVLLWKLRRKTNGDTNATNKAQPRQNVDLPFRKAYRGAMNTTRESDLMTSPNEKAPNYEASYDNPIAINQEYMELQRPSAPSGTYESISQN